MNPIKDNGSPNGDQTMSQRQQEQFLTLKELCDYFGIHKRVVYHMVRNGLTEYRFSERKAKYELNEVKAFLIKK
ncbi:helix-turn-helix domain-containing protein [Schleiferiaceae bacterium]|nr:helix-turn-helix domain-containing protein [Schleiferiaceae bacterium]